MKENIFSLFEKQQEQETKDREPIERMPGEEPAPEEPEADKAAEAELEPESKGEVKEDANA